jgi:uncharacterized protein involved in exopolysaccharide biosynthesis
LRDDRTGLDILLDFLHILVRKRNWVLGFTLACTVIAIITVLLLPPTYRVGALVKPPSSDNGNPMSSLLENAGPLSGMLGSFLSNQSGSADCLSILGSSIFAQKVIDRFDLVKVYKFHKKKTVYISDVMKAFRKKFSFELTDEDALLLTVEDKDVVRAKEMMTYMTQLLDSMYIDLQKRTVRQKLDYFNERVALAESDMTRLEDSLATFQKTYNLYLPEQQVKSMLEVTGKLEMQIEVLSQEMDLEAALRGRETAHYQKLGLQRQRMGKELKARFGGRTDSSSLSLPIRIVPALALEYYRLERAFTIKFTLFKFLIQQAEMLKLEQAKNIKAVSVIDPPFEDRKRVAPKRRVIVQVVFIASFIFAALIAVLWALWERHRRDGTATYGRFVSIGKAFSARK